MHEYSKFSPNPEFLKCINRDGVRTRYFVRKLKKDGELIRLSFLFESCERRRQSYFNSKNWREYINLHLPEYREQAFDEIAEWVESPVYNQLVGEIWTDNEIVYSASCFVIAMLRNDPPHNFADAMTADELAILNKLPAQFEAFRAHEHHNKWGACWTLNQHTAYIYSVGFGWPYVTRIEAKKENVIAFFNRRGEDELIIRTVGCRELETIDTRQSPGS
jgi:hypothetical protein